MQSAARQSEQRGTVLWWAQCSGERSWESKSSAHVERGGGWGLRPFAEAVCVMHHVLSCAFWLVHAGSASLACASCPQVQLHCPPNSPCVCPPPASELTSSSAAPPL